MDIAATSAIARSHSLTLVVDNTFASPALQQPLSLGADIVVHSVTKYIGGHSDVVMGCLATNSAPLYTQLKFLQNAIGAVPAPFDCFLALRGLKTLHLRMAQHCRNAALVAEYLQQHPLVEKVVVSRAALAPPARHRTEADGSGAGWHDHLLSEGRARGESRVFVGAAAVCAGGVAGCGGEPGGAPGHHDARGSAGGAPEAAGDQRLDGEAERGSGGCGGHREGLKQALEAVGKFKGPDGESKEN